MDESFELREAAAETIPVLSGMTPESHGRMWEAQLARVHPDIVTTAADYETARNAAHHALEAVSVALKNESIANGSVIPGEPAAAPRPQVAWA